MKKLLSIIMLMLCISFTSLAQNTVRDSNGNFIAITAGVKTKYTYNDGKGYIYPVYQNMKGEYFYYKKSPTTGKLSKIKLKL